MTTFAPVPETKNTRILIILHLAVFLAGWTGIFGRLISLGGLPLVWYRMMVSVVVLASVLALMRRLEGLFENCWMRYYPRLALGGLFCQHPGFQCLYRRGRSGYRSQPGRGPKGLEFLRISG